MLSDICKPQISRKDSSEGITNTWNALFSDDEIRFELKKLMAEILDLHCEGRCSARHVRVLPIFQVFLIIRNASAWIQAQSWLQGFGNVHRGSEVHGRRWERVRRGLETSVGKQSECRGSKMRDDVRKYMLGLGDGWEWVIFVENVWWNLKTGARSRKWF